jgi:2'-5' RNA ligase
MPYTGTKTGENDQVGIFIPLPKHLAIKYKIKDKDKSPSHVTLFYIGSIPEEFQDQLPKLVEKIFKTISVPIRAKINGLDYFHNPEQTVAITPILFNKDLGKYREILREELVSLLGEVADDYLIYKPHCTLDYLPPWETYKGEIPEGEWEFDKVEIWGLPKVSVIKLGNRNKEASQILRDSEGNILYTYNEQQLKNRRYKK